MTRAVAVLFLALATGEVAPAPVGAVLLAASLLYFRFYGNRKLAALEDGGGENVTPARTESYFARTYGIEGDVFELAVSAESPLVGMSVAEAESMMRRAGIRWLSTTTKSIEEIATTILQEIRPERLVY